MTYNLKSVLSNKIPNSKEGSVLREDLEKLRSGEMPANVPPNVVSMLLNAAIGNIAKYGKPTISYDDLVGKSSDRSEQYANWEPGERETLHEGFAGLFDRLIGPHVSLPEGADLREPRVRLSAIQGIHSTDILGQDGQRQTYRAAMRSRFGIDLSYQGLPNRKLLELSQRDIGIGDYLHFGVSKSLSEDFSGAIRVYVHGDDRYRPAIADHVIAHVREATGFPPRGKIFDGSISDRRFVRSDGLLFVAFSPKELSEVVFAAAQLQKDRPALMHGPNKLILGTPAGSSSVRIAQEPKADIIQESFNQSQESLIHKALGDIFGSLAYYEDIETRRQIRRKIESEQAQYLEALTQALARESAVRGWHSEDMNFNSEQDLSVVQDAVRTGLDRVA